MKSVQKPVLLFYLKHLNWKPDVTHSCFCGRLAFSNHKSRRIVSYIVLILKLINGNIESIKHISGVNINIPRGQLRCLLLIEVCLSSRPSCWEPKQRFLLIISTFKTLSKVCMFYVNLLHSRL